jgi:hypothetical protein
VPEEEEDLFLVNDTIEGPRAPAVKPERMKRLKVYMDLRSSLRMKGLSL